MEKQHFIAVPENGFSMDRELRANSLDKLWDKIEEWYHSDPKERNASGVPYDLDLDAHLIDDTITISNYIFGVVRDGEILSSEELNELNKVASILTTQEQRLLEIYETVYGTDNADLYTHDELIVVLKELTKCYDYVVENVYAKGERL